MEERDDFLNIDTPENVVFGYEIAGLGSRFMAALLDTLFIVILQGVVQVVLVAVLSGVGELAGSIIAGIFIFLVFIFLWGYYIYFEIAWNGQTPGKRWVGLRTIRADGTPAGAGELVIRNLVRLVDFLPVAYGVGVVAMFIHPQARRLGDLAAGTLVVFDRQPVALENVTSAPRRTYLKGDIPPEMAEWPLEKLTQRDLSVIEAYLQRRRELANAPQMGEQLLRRTFARLGLTPPNGRDLARTPEMLAQILHLARSPEAREDLRRAVQAPPPAAPAPGLPAQPLTAAAVARLQRVDLMNVEKFLAQRYSLARADEAANDLLDLLYARMELRRPEQSYREMVATLEKITALAQGADVDGGET
jgi:uncharacterized RDD family membrane protein YckC